MQEILLKNDKKLIAFLHENTSDLSLNQAQKLLSSCSSYNFFNLEQLYQSIHSNQLKFDMLVVELGETQDQIFAHPLWQSIYQQSPLPFIVTVPEQIAKQAETLRHFFQIGAKDILVRPFGAIELVVKLENLLEKKVAPSGAYLADQLILQLDGKKIKDLTLKQAQLLSLFLRSNDRIAKREEIKQKVWQDITIHPKTIDVHLYNLRRKLAHYGYMIKSLGEGQWTLIATKK